MLSEVENGSDSLWIILSLIGLVIIITWIWQLVRLSKRKSKVAFTCILIFGLLFPTLPITTFISLFLGRGKEEDKEDDEKKKKSISDVVFVKSNANENFLVQKLD